MLVPTPPYALVERGTVRKENNVIIKPDLSSNPDRSIRIPAMENNPNASRTRANLEQNVERDWGETPCLLSIRVYSLDQKLAQFKKLIHGVLSYFGHIQNYLETEGNLSERVTKC